MQELNITLLSGQLHTTQKSYIPKDLKTSAHVWLRTNRLRKPLETPYSEPYKVIRKQTFRHGDIDRWWANSFNWEIETSSTHSCSQEHPPHKQSLTDNTKNIPATTSEIQQDTQEPIIIRSSRHVHFSRHNDYFYYTSKYEYERMYCGNQ